MPRMSRREVAAAEELAPLPSFQLGDDATIEPVEQIKHDEVELEAFMQEPVVINIMEAQDENATPMVEVGVNGRRMILPRGKDVTVPRCYVERLARAKRTVISQNLDPSLREQINRINRRQVLDYPFSTVQDTDKGRQWLKQVLAEA